ncbi:unnamed protein product [Arabidopsis lyrata]|uniref:Expressed protein n=1 Tax=Arabidopsis lyrata subsp. lyrata TaxID=81972 RepID=D7MQK8_ARALL|nr:expressed protein [Arabidopsis lyrata subsp. lyrata]CAH8280748.1 unnamed protein product [Arabidopsis lyrata]
MSRLSVLRFGLASWWWVASGSLCTAHHHLQISFRRLEWSVVASVWLQVSVSSLRSVLLRFSQATGSGA